ncbi:hypothetical protein JCM3774_003274 [Rhodotorula dairenensis]
MAPAASKSKAYSSGVATQADDAKYRQKYGELKKKLVQVEEDNTKLSVKILRSKKAIQRLRIERAILYDRLQSTVAPTNPYALSSAAHLATLASSSSSSAATAAAGSSSSTGGMPPTILQAPAYALADPEAPALFLRQLDAQKLAALQHSAGREGGLEFGAKPVEGVVGEAERAHQHQRLLAAGGAVEERSASAATEAEPAPAAAGEGDSGVAAGTGAVQVPQEAPAAAAAAAAVPEAIEVPRADAQPMAMDPQP